MGKFGFKLKKKPKNKSATAIAPQKRGRSQLRKKQPNQNIGPSLTTARPSPASMKPPYTDTQLQYTATQPPPTAAEPTSTSRLIILTSTPTADNPPAHKRSPPPKKAVWINWAKPPHHGGCSVVNPKNNMARMEEELQLAALCTKINAI